MADDLQYTDDSSVHVAYHFYVTTSEIVRFVCRESAMTRQHRRKMAIYTKTASNPKYVVYTSVQNVRATRSVRMILEVFCMQFDTYAPCMYPRISKFSLV